MNEIICVADFETVVYEGQESTEVWSFAIKQLYTHETVVFNNIVDGMVYLIKLSKSNNVKCFFHNLKFDGSFILQYLLTNKKYKHGLYTDGTLKKPNKLDIWEFNYLVSVRGQFYNITLCTGRHKIVFVDSVKLLPFSLKKIGEEFCNKYKKLEMEYDGKRYAGWKISDVEMDYIKADVDVLCEAMEIMQNEGHTKMTIGSCCVHEFKNTFIMGDYDEVFPDCSKIDLPCGITAHEYTRLSYKGAWCYLVPEKADKVYHDGVTLDVNSLYPFVMLDGEYPIGKPYYTDSYNEFINMQKRKNIYYFVRFKCKFEIKDGFLPFIQIKNSLAYKSNEMLKASSIYDDDGNVIENPEIELCMTCTDFLRFKDFYNITYFSFLDCICFTSVKGLFESYINKYKKIKETSQGAKRMLAKLYLNNLYGKLATGIDSSYKVAYLQDGVLKWHIVDESNKKPMYMPVGSAITSYARDYTIRHAQANYHGPYKPGFIYADTDSCHMDLSIDKCVGFKLDKNIFGCWDLEKEWDIGYFVRQKTYAEHDKKGWSITCAGMPQKCKDIFVDGLNSGKYTIEDFTHGLQIDGKLSFKQIKGGPILYSGVYTLK